MTTHGTDDDFEFDGTLMTTSETDDDFGLIYFVKQDGYLEPLSPHEVKVDSDVMLPFFRLAIWASGYELDEPIDKLLAHALKILKNRHAVFMDDQLTVEFGRFDNLN